MTLKTFQVAVPQSELDDLQRRPVPFRAPLAPGDRGWDDSVNLDYLATLVAYWRDDFDWRAQEEKLNELTHLIVDVGGSDPHIVHKKGSGPAPLPLVLAHGWPDSFQRFIKIIPLLTDPAAHGGNDADAFDVVIPSLPGYAFSPRQTEGPTGRDFGRLLHKLMTDVLGYARYGAHGGDMGAVVCDQLYANDTDALVGVHFANVPMMRPAPEAYTLTNAEGAFVAGMKEFYRVGAGYMHIQSTKPWTPLAALNDSPAGLAAWIVEKMYGWSDCGGNLATRFTKDEILTNIMICWITQSIGTSFLSYRDLMKPPQLPPASADPARATPCGFALLPKDIVGTPREWAERYYNVCRWTDLPGGGHFTAWEEPRLLAEELRAFFRPLRENSDFRETKVNG